MHFQPTQKFIKSENFDLNLVERISYAKATASNLLNAQKDAMVIEERVKNYNPPPCKKKALTRKESQQLKRITPLNYSKSLFRNPCDAINFKKLKITDVIPESGYAEDEEYKVSFSMPHARERKYEQRERLQYKPDQHIPDLVLKRVEKYQASKTRMEPVYVPKVEQTSKKVTKHSTHVIKTQDMTKRGVLNISPFLDKHQTPQMTLEERVDMYNKRHKCDHNLCFNKIDEFDHHYYKVSCDHELETETNIKGDNCYRCGNVTVNINRRCHCERIERCLFCKRTHYYTSKDENLIRSQIHDCAGPLPEIKLTTFKPPKSRDAFFFELANDRPPTFAESVLRCKNLNSKERRKGRKADEDKLAANMEALIINHPDSQITDVQAEGFTEILQNITGYATRGFTAIGDMFRGGLDKLKDKLSTYVVDMALKEKYPTLYNTINYVYAFLRDMLIAFGDLQPIYRVLIVAQFLGMLLAGKCLLAFGVLGLTLVVNKYAHKAFTTKPRFNYDLKCETIIVEPEETRTDKVKQQLRKVRDYLLRGYIFIKSKFPSRTVDDMSEVLKRQEILLDNVQTSNEAIDKIVVNEKRLDGKIEILSNHVSKIIADKVHVEAKFNNISDNMRGISDAIERSDKNIMYRITKITDLLEERIEALEVDDPEEEEDNTEFCVYGKTCKRENCTFNHVCRKDICMCNLFHSGDSARCTQNCKGYCWKQSTFKAKCDARCKNHACQKQHYCLCVNLECPMLHHDAEMTCEDCTDECWVKSAPHYFEDCASLGLLELETFQAEAGCDSVLQFLKDIKIPKNLMKSAIVSAVALMAGFNTFSNAAKNFDYMKDKFMQFISNLFNFSYTYSDTRKWLAWQLGKKDSPVHQLTVKVCEREQAIAHENFDKIPMIENELPTLVAESNEFLMKHGVMYDPVIATFRKNLDACMKKPWTMPARSGEPFCIKLYGDPGVGKSTIWPILASTIMRDVNGEVFKTTQEIKDHSYVRNPNEDFWSGLDVKRHQVVVYDDFGQGTDELDYKEFISLISSSAFIPNQASIDQNSIAVKGQSYSPKAVICCSNVGHIYNAKTVTSTEALNRRPHMLVRVMKIDTRKPTSISNTQFILEEVKYKDHFERTVDIRGLKNIVREMYKYHVDRVSEVNEALDAYLDTDAEVGTDIWSLLLLTGVVSTYNIQYYVENVLQALGLIAILEQTITRKQVVGGIMAVILSFFCILYTIYNILKVEEESGTTKTRNTPKSVQAESGLTDIQKLLRKNQGYICIGDIFVTGIFVTGTIFLTVEHAFRNGENRYYPNGQDLVLYSYGQSEPLVTSFDLSKLYKIPDKDLVLYDFGKYVPSKKNIIAHFMEGNEPLVNQSATILRYYKGEPSAETFVINNEGETIRYTSAGQMYLTQNTIMGMYASEAGDCGAVIMFNNESYPKIVSVHTASNKQAKYSQVVWRDLIQHSVDAIKDNYNTISHDPPIVRAEGSANKYATGKFIDLGQSYLRSRQPTKTTLKPSLLHDKIVEHTTEPSILHDNDPRNTKGIHLKEEAVARYNNAVISPKETIPVIEDTMRQLGKDLNSRRTIGLRRTLTTHEAINGIPYYPYLDSMDMSTSAGGVHALKQIKKSDMFIQTEQGWVFKPEYAEQYQAFEDSFKQGIIPSDFFYTGMLKDERLKLKKIYDEPKSRLFSMSNMFNTILYRKYFLPADARCMQVCQTSYIGPGLNRSGSEWHRWALHMTEVGTEYAIDGDYKNWDGSTPPQYLMALEFHYNEMMEYTILDRIVVRTWLKANTFAPELIDDLFILRIGTTPSGKPGTLMMNTHVNECIGVVAWIFIVRKPYGNYYWYKQAVRSSDTGDDLIKNVRQDFKDDYNFQTLKENLTNQGFKFTPGDKDSDDYLYKSFFDCSYLKCTTTKINGYFLPKQDLNALLEQLNWVRLSAINKDNFTQTEQNANNVLRALVTHGDEVYNDIYNKIKKLQPEMKLMDYKSAFAMFMHYGYFPGTEFDACTKHGLQTTGEVEQAFKATLVNPESGKQSLQLVGTLSQNLQMFFKYTTTEDRLYTGYLHNVVEGKILRSELKIVFTAINQEIAKRNKTCGNTTATKLLDYIVIDGRASMVLATAEPFYGDLTTGFYVDNVEKVSTQILKDLITQINFQLATSTKAEAGSMDFIKGVMGSVADQVVESFTAPVDLFGAMWRFDKPQIAYQPDPVVVRNCQNLAGTKGGEYIQILQEDPKAQIKCDKEHFGVASDPTSIIDLCHKMSYVGSSNWDATMQPGTILGENWVGPLSAMRVTTTPQDFTALDYISRKYRFWRGGLKYTLDFVTSNFHEGKVDITWHPGSMQAPAEPNAGMSQYAVSYALKDGKNTISFIIPFLSETPYKRVWNGTQMSSTYDPQKSHFQDYFNGSMSVRVSAPLKAPSTVVNNIAINVFVQACDDYSVSQLSMNNSSLEPDLLLGRDRAIFTMAESGEISAEPLNIVEYSEEQHDQVITEDVTSADSTKKLDAKQGIIIADKEDKQIITSRAVMANTRAEKHLGDKMWALNDMLARWTLVDTLQWEMGQTPGTVIKRYDVLLDLLKQEINSMPFHLFTYFRCKCVRLKVQVVASKFHQGRALISYIPTMTPYAKWAKTMNTNDYIHNLHAFLDPTNGTTAEFEIPFIHYKGWLDLANFDVLGNITFQVFNPLQAITGAANSVEVKLFVSIDTPEFKIPRPGGTSLTNLFSMFRYPGFNPKIHDTRAQSGNVTSTDNKKKKEISKFETAGVNDIDQLDAIVVAPTRAITTDPEVPHFSDHTETWRELGKRYNTMVYDLPAMPGDTTLSLPVDFASPIWNGHIAQELAHMFALFRGSTAYKFKFMSAANYNEGLNVATFTPELVPDGTLNIPGMNQDHPYNNMNAYATWLSTGYGEFKIPQLTMSATQTVGIYSSADNDRDNYEYSPSVIIRRIQNGGHDEGKLITHAALGDEAAFGVFIGLPNIILHQTWPDKWTSAQRRNDGLYKITLSPRI